MRERPSLSAALTTSLSPCTSLPTRQRVRTSTGGSDDEYFDVDIISDEDTLEHDIMDGDSSDDMDEGVTTTVGVNAGFMAPLQGVVAADELIFASSLALVRPGHSWHDSYALQAPVCLRRSGLVDLVKGFGVEKQRKLSKVSTGFVFGPSLPALAFPLPPFYSFLAQSSFDFETFPRNAVIGPTVANERRAMSRGWGQILEGYSAAVHFCGKWRHRQRNSV